MGEHRAGLTSQHLEMQNFTLSLLQGITGPSARSHTIRKSVRIRQCPTKVRIPQRAQHRADCAEEEPSLRAGKAVLKKKLRPGVQAQCPEKQLHAFPTQKRYPCSFLSRMGEAAKH